MLVCAPAFVWAGGRLTFKCSMTDISVVDCIDWIVKAVRFSIDPYAIRFCFSSNQCRFHRQVGIVAWAYL